MSALGSNLARRVSPQPARDLVFVDAAAVTIALFIAYAVWAATKSSYPLSWDGVWPPVRQALPVSALAAILSCAALGLYGSGAPLARLRTHVAAVAYATALVVVIAAWYRGDVPQIGVVVAALIAGSALIHLGRRFYWRVAG
jgi:hypothetical protein